MARVEKGEIAISAEQRAPLKSQRQSGRSRPRVLEKTFTSGTAKISLGGDTVISDITVVLQQAAETQVIAYCTLHMDSLSEYSERAPDLRDIEISLETKDENGYHVTWLDLNRISRTCGKHVFTTKQENQVSHINAVALIAQAWIRFRYFDRVHWCR